jgi:DNA-binding SARP family transcriptional activator
VVVESNANGYKCTGGRKILLEAQLIEKNITRNSVLQIFCLGVFRVIRPGETMPVGVTSKHKMWLLFKYLVAHKGSGIHTEKIMELLWPGSENPTDTAILRTTISRLKSLLEPQRTVYQRSSYILYCKDSCAFNLHAPFWLDIDEFESSCTVAHRLGGSNREMAIELYLDALNFYQGDFLTEDPDLEWAIIPREHYRRLFIDSTLEISAWLVENHEYTKASALLRRAIKIDPYVEGMQILLMKTMLGMGELKAAAEHYSYCSSFLYKELGVKPSAEWKSLYKQLREPETESTGKRILEGNLETVMKDCGPLVCETDFFWSFLLFERRRLARLGGESSLIIFELSSGDPRNIAEAFVELQSMAYGRLRKCDITCQLDERHLGVLLPFTGVEGGKITAFQIKEVFTKKINPTRPVLQFKVKRIIPF